MLTKFGGTPLYRAPEQLKIDKAKQAVKFNFKVDVWSVGIMCYELCTGKWPFYEEGDTDSQIEERIRTQPVPMQDLARFSQGLQELISMTLNK